MTHATAATIGKFRRFRWSRPFWGALFLLFGGFVIFILPLGPTQSIIHAGIGGLAGFACGLILMGLGVLVLIAPSQRYFAAIAAVLVSLASFPLTNLGGFIIGMMAGIIGACLVFAWVPDKKNVSVPEPPEEPVTPEPAESSEPDWTTWDHGSFKGQGRR